MRGQWKFELKKEGEVTNGDDRTKQQNVRTGSGDQNERRTETDIELKLQSWTAAETASLRRMCRS